MKKVLLALITVSLATACGLLNDLIPPVQNPLGIDNQQVAFQFNDVATLGERAIDVKPVNQYATYNINRTDLSNITLDSNLESALNTLSPGFKGDLGIGDITLSGSCTQPEQFTLQLQQATLTLKDDVNTVDLALVPAAADDAAADQKPLVYPNVLFTKQGTVYKGANNTTLKVEWAFSSGQLRKIADILGKNGNNTVTGTLKIANRRDKTDSSLIGCTLSTKLSQKYGRVLVF